MLQYVKLDKHTRPVGVLDFSWLLDAPAGKHGFTRVRDGHLYFEDGTRALFFGMDFPVRSLLCDHESALLLADKMASLGVNVIRVHAADAVNREGGWSMEPDMPLIDYRTGSSRVLNPEGLERLDYFLWQLKLRGIYLHMDLNVARNYMPGDDLDYPDAPIGGKMLGMVNRRLIELQKEYATQLLTHVNEYTGLAYIDDPAVMTIQITNEDRVDLYGANSAKDAPTPYVRELTRRFNWFLLSKYGSDRHLREAWTHDGVCALTEGENAEEGTVQLYYDDTWRFSCNLSGPYGGDNSPVRNADTADFAIGITRDYFREMMNHVRSLGAKVPVACSNLVHGAPEVYAMSDADIMENNAYWNHPKYGEIMRVPDAREYVSTDPRLFSVLRPGMQSGHHPSQLSQAVMAGMPFVVTEWNEYGSVPYHSASFLMTTAYACLQDWDGLILYTYFTRGKSAFDQAEDFVENIMESYNDPAVICQHGTMAAMFLKQLIAPAKTRAEVCWTQSDIRTYSQAFGMASCFLPYVIRMQNRYLERDHYTGDADLAVSGGATATGNYSEAKHAFCWNELPYAEAARHNATGEWFFSRAIGADAKDLLGIGSMDAHAAVIRDWEALTREGNETLFSRAIDRAMKEWGILPEDAGLLADGSIRSETGELTFAPGNARFTANAEGVCVFAGKAGEARIFDMTAVVDNERMTLSCLPLAGEGGKLLLTAVGRSGNSGMHFEGEENWLIHQGKLAIDSWEGSLRVPGGAKLFALSMYGERVREIPGETDGGDTVFTLDGAYASANFELIRE